MVEQTGTVTIRNNTVIMRISATTHGKCVRMYWYCYEYACYAIFS